MNERNACYTISITELTFCELAQLVVDSLLHALQDLRYNMELAHGGAGRCGQRIVNANSTLMIKHTYYCLG